MLEDKLLIWKFKHGDENAPLRIYEKYKDHLLTLATALLNDASAAEDILHNVFVSFAEGISNFELNGSLKSYLSVCVANRARNFNKEKQRRHAALEEAAEITSKSAGPVQMAMIREESQLLIQKMQHLAYEQREVILMHLKAGLKFKTIADLQGVSTNTVLSRYRYGLEKLRSLFDEETTV